MESIRRITAHTIGHIASETLSKQSKASICGVTSKGIFAITPSRDILFFTDQPYRGPLTINLHEGLSSLQSLSPNSPLSLSSNKVFFNRKQIEIQILAKSQIWYPPKLSKSTVTQKMLSTRSDEIEQRLKHRSINNTSAHFSDLISTLSKGITSNEVDQLLEELKKLIGYGSGLTPSGDDFVCGFIIAARVWQDILLSGFPLHPFITGIQQIARQKTTSLSANLIACAAQGSADERVLNTLIWLHEGEGNLNQIIKELRSYGSSSGFDTLRGIIAAIQSSKRN